MPSLRELLAEEPPGRKGPLCGVDSLLHVLSPEDAADLRDMLADPTIRGTTLSRVLERAGHEIAAPVIQNHRRGGCQCGKRKAAA